jgi:hypothetical protein
VAALSVFLVHSLRGVDISLTLYKMGGVDVVMWSDEVCDEH